MATYTVQGGQSWLGLSMQLYGDYEHAKYLRKLNRGTTLSQGVVIRTGGAVAGERAPDINPWGLSAGQVPEYAVGTDIANTYLAAIGQAGAEVPGVTAAGEGFLGLPASVTGTTPYAATTRPPAELAPQAQMVGPEQLGAAPAVTPSFAPGLTEQQELEAAALTGAAGVPVTPEPITMAGLTGADIGPQQEQIVMGEGSDWYQPSPSGTFIASTLEGMQSIVDLPGLGWESQPETGVAEAEADKRKRVGTTVMPAAVYPYGTTSAANYTARMMLPQVDAEGNVHPAQIPLALSPAVVEIMGITDQYLQATNFVWDAASGLYHKQPDPTGGDGTTGGTGGGRRRRGRRGYGSGRSPYGSSFKSSAAGLINWRHGFGG